MYGVAPSVGCADLLHLEEQIRILDRSGIDWFHIDVMDGTFVPNFCLGTDMIRAIRSISERPIYTHVMAVHPENHVEMFKSCGSDYMAFHIETTNAPFRTARMIRAAGMKAGVAVNPATPIAGLEDLLEELDAVTLMTIEPGIVGPRFMDMSYARIERLRGMIDRVHPGVLLEIDGGVNPENGKRCLEAGADVLVAGIHAVFRKEPVPLEEQVKIFSQSIKRNA